MYVKFICNGFVVSERVDWTWPLPRTGESIHFPTGWYKVSDINWYLDKDDLLSPRITIELSQLEIVGC